MVGMGCILSTNILAWCAHEHAPMLSDMVIRDSECDAVHRSGMTAIV